MTHPQPDHKYIIHYRSGGELLCEVKEILTGYVSVVRLTREGLKTWFYHEQHRIKTDSVLNFEEVK